jgi:hypothetical protein
LPPSSARCVCIVAHLASASGCQDHTTSPSAPRSARLTRHCGHRIPLPTFMTIAKRPSCGGGTGGQNHRFLKNRNIFEWRTGQANQLERVGEIKRKNIRSALAVSACAVQPAGEIARRANRNCGRRDRSLSTLMEARASHYLRSTLRVARRLRTMRSLSSLRERYCARRGRAFARPVGIARGTMKARPWPQSFETHHVTAMPSDEGANLCVAA